MSTPMGLFGNQADSKLEARIRDLEARLAQVETSQKSVRSEWEEAFEKIMNALRRLGKRARDAAEESPAATGATPDANPTVVAIMRRREEKLARRRFGG